MSTVPEHSSQRNEVYDVNRTNSKCTYPQYHYHPLKATNNIRLLKIEPTRDEFTLHGSLLEHEVAGGTAYECLSYCCGKERANHLILIDGAALPITQNLSQALRSLVQIKKTALLWIDAIRIDQENPEERSQQVQIMFKIYSGAQHVMAYLGKERDGSQIVPDLCNNIVAAHIRRMDTLDAQKTKPFRTDEFEELGLPRPNDLAWTQRST